MQYDTDHDLWSSVDEESMYTTKEMHEVPASDFFFAVFFWPLEYFREQIKTADYFDEGSGDWSRELEHNAKTLDNILAAL